MFYFLCLLLCFLATFSSSLTATVWVSSPVNSFRYCCRRSLLPPVIPPGGCFTATVWALISIFISVSDFGSEEPFALTLTTKKTRCNLTFYTLIKKEMRGSTSFSKFLRSHSLSLNSRDSFEVFTKSLKNWLVLYKTILASIAVLPMSPFSRDGDPYGGRSSGASTPLGQILSSILGLMGLMLSSYFLWPWIKFRKVNEASEVIGSYYILSAHFQCWHLIRLVMLFNVFSLPMNPSSIRETFYLPHRERTFPSLNQECCNALRVIFCNASSKVQERSLSPPLVSFFVERPSPLDQDSCSVLSFTNLLQHSSQVQEISIPSLVLFVVRLFSVLSFVLNRLSTLLFSHEENRLKRSAGSALRAISEWTSFTISLMDALFRPLSSHFMICNSVMLSVWMRTLLRVCSPIVIV